MNQRSYLTRTAYVCLQWVAMGEDEEIERVCIHRVSCRPSQPAGDRRGVSEPPTACDGASDKPRAAASEVGPYADRYEASASASRSPGAQGAERRVGGLRAGRDPHAGRRERCRQVDPAEGDGRGPHSPTAASWCSAAAASRPDAALGTAARDLPGSAGADADGAALACSRTCSSGSSRAAACPSRSTGRRWSAAPAPTSRRSASTSIRPAGFHAEHRQQQQLECARALVHRCNVIFFDEPTSPLTGR
jgi:hypothetical protein